MVSGKSMKKILIIDDELDVAETMKMLLEREGYEAEYQLNPRKGLEMVEEFDDLCLDIMMPVMTGREVLAEMKKRGIHVPVIIVSAIGMPIEVENELTGKYPGLVVGFVSKPYMHTDLVKEIKKHIEK